MTLSGSGDAGIAVHIRVQPKEAEITCLKAIELRSIDAAAQKRAWRSKGTQNRDGPGPGEPST
jgi:hypothetical protein